MKVCAFMSLYNEEDVIEETVKKLISTGVDIYLLDNGCTDETISKVESFVGRGIIDIKQFISIENGRRVFKLSEILEQFELLSARLPYEWFMISDADEIKYSPWENTTMNEAIELVDRKGYNLINFKLFDFRPTGEPSTEGNIEERLSYFSSPEPSSSIQMKCWKKNKFADIKSLGGHVIRVPNPQVFPIRFINKHYPIRSVEHGMRKLKAERFDRYSNDERQRGWHSHYNHLNVDDESSFRWRKEDLTLFDMNQQRLKLFEETTELLMDSSRVFTNHLPGELERFAERFALTQNVCSAERAKELFNLATNIYTLSTRYSIPPVELDNGDAWFVETIVATLRSKDYLTGELVNVRNAEHIRLITSRKK